MSPTTCNPRSTVGSYDLSTYNKIQRQLLEPFDEDQISEIDGFSYVDPYHYRMRWHKIFTQGFSFRVKDVHYGANGMSAQAYFHACIDDIEFEIEVPCYEKYIKSSESGNILKLEQSVNMLSSAGCKAVSRELGIGLHLYAKAAMKGGSKKGGNSSSGNSYKGASNGSSSSPATWDGSAEVTFGQKWRGKKWSEVDDDFLNYLTSDPDPSKHRKEAVWEKSRRAANNVNVGQQQGQAAKPPDGIPF